MFEDVPIARSNARPERRISALQSVLRRTPFGLVSVLLGALIGHAVSFYFKYKFILQVDCWLISVLFGMGIGGLIHALYKRVPRTTTLVTSVIGFAPTGCFLAMFGVVMAVTGAKSPTQGAYHQSAFDDKGWGSNETLLLKAAIELAFWYGGIAGAFAGLVVARRGRRPSFDLVTKRPLGIAGITTALACAVMVGVCSGVLLGAFDELRRVMFVNRPGNHIVEHKPEYLLAIQNGVETGVLGGLAVGITVGTMILLVELRVAPLIGMLLAGSCARQLGILPLPGLFAGGLLGALVGDYLERGSKSPAPRPFPPDPECS